MVCVDNFPAVPKPLWRLHELIKPWCRLQIFQGFIWDQLVYRVDKVQVWSEYATLRYASQEKTIVLYIEFQILKDIHIVNLEVKLFLSKSFH